MGSSTSSGDLLHEGIEYFRKTLRSRRVVHRTCVKIGRPSNGDDDPGSDSEWEEWSDEEEYYETVRERETMYTSSDLCIRMIDEGHQQDTTSYCNHHTHRESDSVRAVFPPHWGDAVTTRRTAEVPAPGCNVFSGVGSATTYAVHHSKGD